ncbi:PEPxxWA-CTERM sorting domain-containing protein [Sphingomonas limnosediminicola]
MAAAAFATIGFATPASASISVSATPGCAVYCGPTPITYDFDSTVPIFLGGAIVGPGTSSGLFAQPLGSVGKYFSVGPSTSSPANITIGNDIASFSFIWGSVDEYNSLTVNTMAGSMTFTGADIAALIPGFADGNQSSPTSNPIVTFTLTGDDRQAVNFNMTSTQNAFEIDSISVAAVPEPATWGMMLLGFGAMGFVFRNRKTRPISQLV